MIFGSGFGPQDIHEPLWTVSYSKPTYEVKCTCPVCGTETVFALEPRGHASTSLYDTVIRCKECHNLVEYTVQVIAKVLKCEETP